MIRLHIDHFKYLLLHKRYVWQEGRKLGLSPFQLILHDLQKLTPTEWGPYTRRFYGARDRHDFYPAWLHHQRVGGKHHWEYWLVPHGDGTLYAIRMPDKYQREMVADWRGAGRAQGNLDTTGWYEKNRDLMVLHKETRAWVERELGYHRGS